MKSRPNFSAISSCHFTISPGGQTIMIRFARCRSSSSSATRPASIVLPRPTSSASSRLTRGASIARATGSSWYSSTITPERSGACSVFTSADVTADQRTASRKAARRSGGSKPVRGDLGQRACGEDPPTWLDFPDDRKALAVAAVLDALQGQQRAAVAARALSLTTQRCPRTSTRLPSCGISSCAVVTRVPMPRRRRSRYPLPLTVATDNHPSPEVSRSVGCTIPLCTVTPTGKRQPVAVARCRRGCSPNCRARRAPGGPVRLPGLTRAEG